MTRPRPTGLCVARVHIVTGARAKAGEREGAQQSASERERWKAERNEHTRCSSVDDSSLPWGARATHTRPLVVHVRSCATQCAGNRQRSTRPHSDLYTSRGTATGCIYEGDQHVDPEPALSGSHRPHQHHSITRGTLWNHLPNHLVTSTQRNATARHTVSFRGLFRARLREGGRGEER